MRDRLAAKFLQKKKDDSDLPGSAAKNYVFFDSVLCKGRISEDPVKAWKEKIDWFMNSIHCRE